MRRTIFTFAIAAVLLAQPLVVLADESAATLHPGDKISVMVYNHPELASEPVLDGMGRISVPLAGTVDAASLTPEQLNARIAQALKRYVISPAVDTQLLLAGTSIFVVGPMAGVLVYSPGETLISALSQAQSLQATPNTVTNPIQSGQAPASSPTIDLRTLRESSIDLRQVVLRRDGVDQAPIDVDHLIANGESGPVLVPGDTISLRQRPVDVKVSGVVEHPTVAHLYADEPLRDALRQAGGVNDLTAQYKFTLVRNGQSLLVTNMSPEIAAPAVPGDEILVPEAPRVTFAGQVSKIGSMAVQGDPTLLSALYQAGGPQSNGDLRHIAVLHQGTQKVYDLTDIKNGVPVNNPVLADGDAIFVPASRHADFTQIFQGLLVLATFH